MPFPSRTRAVALAAALVIAAAAPGAARQIARPQRFTAIALPPGAEGSPTPIDIVIERWSTDAENDQLMTALTEKGTKGMLGVLLKLPRVGSFAGTGAAGYPIRYARSVKGSDGLERITLATDRYIGFWEAAGQGRSLDYPITLIQLRLKPGGEGEGEAAPAAQVGIDRLTKLIIVENYDLQPVVLKSVKRSR
jgi:hypothetical protein